MSTAMYGSSDTRIRRGKFEARVSQAPDGRWKTEFDDGHTSYWHTRSEAESEGERRLREVAGPNAYLEGSEFGEEDPGPDSN